MLSQWLLADAHCLQSHGFQHSISSSSTAAAVPQLSKTLVGWRRDLASKNTPQKSNVDTKKLSFLKGPVTFSKAHPSFWGPPAAVSFHSGMFETTNRSTENRRAEASPTFNWWTVWLPFTSNFSVIGVSCEVKLFELQKLDMELENIHKTSEIQHRYSKIAIFLRSKIEGIPSIRAKSKSFSTQFACRK